MFSTTARFVRARLEFCIPWDQTQWFLLFQRRDLCRPYTVFETEKFFCIDSIPMRNATDFMNNKESLLIKMLIN